MKTQTYGMSTPPFRLCSLHPDPFALPITDTLLPLRALAAVHEKKETNWASKYLTAAYNNYRACRENGEAQDSPAEELKYDGKAEWEFQPDGYYHVKYTEGPNDKLWMEEKDLNYLTRLAREGTLEQTESTWRDVLGTWESESKRTTAIARVEAAINTRAETEAKNRMENGR